MPKGILLRLCEENIKANELEIIKGIETDNKQKFEHCLKIACTKAFQELAAFQKISNLLDTQKKNLIFH